MAFTINETNTVSKKYFDTTMTQQVYEGSPFYSKLQDDEQVILSGGTSVQWPLRVKKLDRSRATGPRTKVEFGSDETRTAGDIPWVYYDGDTMIHWDEQVKNSGKGQIVRLIGDRATELMEDIKNKLYEDLFLTTYSSTGQKIVTLDTIIDSADTFAGIAVADAAQWAGQEDASTAALAIFGSGSLSEIRNAATFGKLEPTLHVTTRDLWSKYESKIQPNQRYEDKQMANLGFASLTFHKKPVVSDIFCPAGYWFGVDMDCFELVVHKDHNMKVKDWFELPQAGYPNAFAKYVCWVGNLLTRRRRTSFKFSALDADL